MRRVTSLARTAVAAILVIAAAATHASAQGTTFDKRTIFTFSGAVQVPGATLPAGKYVFRVANPSSPSVLTVLDASERHVLGQFFFVSSPNRTTAEQNRANGKPVLVFYETTAGVPPAIRIFYYPTDIAGRELIYPKEQALKLAAASHRPILATDTNAAKGGKPHLLAVEAAATTPASDASVATTAEFTAPTAVPVIPSQNTQDLGAEPQPVGTSGNDEPRPVGTTGVSDQAAAPSSPAAKSSLPAELPKTAGLSPLIALVGLLALTGGIVLKAARI